MPIVTAIIAHVTVPTLTLAMAMAVTMADVDGGGSRNDGRR